MKHTTLRLLPLLAIALSALMCACGEDDNEKTWKAYTEWRKANTAWFQEQQLALDDNGQNIYSTLTPAWNPSAQVLIKYLNDRTLTEGNLSPMLTSVVNVKYRGTLYNDVPFDSSYAATDSLFTTSLTQVISGWQIALQYMRVGDSAQVIIPYWLGYNSTVSGGIPPYSMLKFDIKLTDIVDYEAKP